MNATTSSTAAAVIRTLDGMAAALSTRRCVEPSYADHVLCELAAQRSHAAFALMSRDDRKAIVAAIGRVEQVLRNHVQEYARG